MDGTHDNLNEQWMALPLFNRATSPDISQNAATWYDPEPAPRPPWQWFMDPSSHGQQLAEMPMQWLMDAPSEPPIPWLMHSSGLSPWIMDSSGLKAPPEPQMQCHIQAPIFESASGPSTPSSSRTLEVSRDEPVLSRPSSSNRNRDSPPELLPDYILSPDTTSSHAKCPFPGCKSTARFTTPRDFRRHYRQHFKRFFCHYENCPQSAPDPHNPSKRGFATRKDRDRHEAKHKPEIRCQWRNPHGEQCTRVFSRMDNMRDHVRRIHKRKS
ncbi:hypothetical protein BDV28DRAFT_145176 [Aspergillus coremiiformis]|uniref:C2H2-type domain-containing protein n=1 Tax=Aspergillus coremiiformis TaxID=138285 RepID=A0A5N6ZG64_9EURO|nr:hypothetical protein BDV28DRAFT_145176 [Aspergillus coremiiformis]